jgi:hypothetical protein
MRRTSIYEFIRRGKAIFELGYGNELFHGSAYDKLAERYGQFPIVLSLEVI